MTKRKSDAAVATTAQNPTLKHVWGERLRRLSSYLKKVKEKSNEHK